jgi:cytochrome c oxidase subunit 4
MNVRRPPRAIVLSILALLALLALTVTLAYQPLGRFNGPIALTIAATKAFIVAAIFMELRERRPLLLAFAGAGVFWFGILLWLSSTDFTQRASFPPTFGTPSITALVPRSNAPQ